jgi:hypothetical protein
MKLLIVAVLALLVAACGNDGTPEPTQVAVPTFTATSIPPTVEPPTVTPLPVILVPTSTLAALPLIEPTVTTAPVPINTPIPPPVVEPTAVPPPPTEPPLIVATVAPVEVAACDCSGNVYNCGDFGTHADAQACFDYCKAAVGTDVHDIDGNDQDGLACESLP